jgi:hypothetical protein
MKPSQVVVLILTVIVMMLIIGYGGSYIFNNVVVKIMPSVKTITPWNFIGLYVLTQILFT